MTRGQSSGMRQPFTLPKYVREAMQRRNQPALFDLEPPTPVSQPPPPAAAAIPELESEPILALAPNHLNSGVHPAFSFERTAMTNNDKTDTDTFGPTTPQPEQERELSTEQVRALLEDRVEAWQERVDYLRDFERGATTEDDRRRCQARADVATDALMDFRRLRKIEREAHAATHAENDRLRAALAEAEARERRLRSAVRRWRQMSQNAFTEEDFDGLECAATEVEDILATAQEVQE